MCCTCANHDVRVEQSGRIGVKFRHATRDLEHFTIERCRATVSNIFQLDSLKVGLCACSVRYFSRLRMKVDFYSGFI